VSLCVGSFAPSRVICQCGGSESRSGRIRNLLASWFWTRIYNSELTDPVPNLLIKLIKDVKKFSGESSLFNFLVLS
jgi:hypothetical protein